MQLAGTLVGHRRGRRGARIGGQDAIRLAVRHAANGGTRFSQ
jgi:hypothetical protein